MQSINTNTVTTGTSSTSVGNRIAEKRKQANITQIRLGIEVGAGETTVCKWEKGKIVPDYLTMALIARELHTTPEYLYYGVKDSNDEMKIDISTLSFSQQNLVRQLIAELLKGC